MRLRRILLTAALAAGVLAACGDGGGRFDDRVDAVRSAVDAGDREAAERALDELSLEIVAAREDGAISGGEADEAFLLVESSRQLLDELGQTATTTTSTTTTSPPPIEDVEDDDEPGEKGKKKGKDDDEEDDD